MLGFFLILQALALIPLCIVPTQKKLQITQTQTNARVALWQKLTHPQIKKLTLDNQTYTFRRNKGNYEVFTSTGKLLYNSQTQTFRFFTQ